MWILVLVLFHSVHADNLEFLKAGKNSKSLSLPSFNPDGMPITPDMIRAECRFQSGWCAGAKVNLKDGSAKVVQSLIVSSPDSFRFANLTYGNYSLEIIYDHNKKKKVVEGVRPGQSIVIDLDTIAK